MDIWSDYSFQWFLVSTIPGWLSWFYVSVLCTRYLEIFMIKNTKFNALGKIFKDEYLWKSGRNQEVMKKNLSEFFFFIYVTDFQVRKTVRQIFFENVISYSFYWHGKLPLAAARVGNMFWKPTLKQVLGKSLDLHIVIRPFQGIFNRSVVWCTHKSR